MHMHPYSAWVLTLTHKQVVYKKLDYNKDGKINFADAKVSQNNVYIHSHTQKF